MPAEPVPLIGSVSGFAVRNTVRSRSHVSSSTREELGVEMAEHRVRASASTTSGYGLQGPGP